MNPITVIIVEDVEEVAHSLKEKLLCFPNVEVLGVCYSVSQAIKSVRKLKPHLLFLDIELPHSFDGFKLLERLEDFEFDFIITTGFERTDYAIKALRMSAIDFLLKPISYEAIELSLKRHEEVQIKDQKNYKKEKLQAFWKNVSESEENKVFLFQSGKSFVKLSSNEIVYIESQGNDIFIYSNPLYNSQSCIKIRKKLSEIQPVLLGHGFLRVHQSYLVNLSYVASYTVQTNSSPNIKVGSGGCIYLKKIAGTNIGSDTGTIPVSRSKKAALLKKINRKE